MTKDKRPALVLRFLTKIAAHNDREWMAAHRAEYDEARAAFEGLTADLIRALAEVDPAVAPLSVSDCTYRFYRDTRFSPDKSPYKRHMGAYVNPRGKKSPHGGYYLHLQPGACEIAGGAYCLEPKLLRAVRESVVDRTDEFRAIVEGERFRALFPVIGLDRVKRRPRRLLRPARLDGARRRRVPRDETLSRLCQRHSRRLSLTRRDATADCCSCRSDKSDGTADRFTP